MGGTNRGAGEPGTAAMGCETMIDAIDAFLRTGPLDKSNRSTT
jgi:hypothetical protein